MRPRAAAALGEAARGDGRVRGRGRLRLPLHRQRLHRAGSDAWYRIGRCDLGDHSRDSQGVGAARRQGPGTSRRRHEAYRAGHRRTQPSRGAGVGGRGVGHAVVDGRARSGAADGDDSSSGGRGVRRAHACVLASSCGCPCRAQLGGLLPPVACSLLGGDGEGGAGNGAVHDGYRLRAALSQPCSVDSLVPRLHPDGESARRRVRGAVVEERARGAVLLPHASVGHPVPVQG
mmetsp:Transcript_99274/g.284023  ORF Transcript_99274/g.284023 Transcript_99274/m.284023 type:complete len:232 (-) Transcript_99274:126-821(-)